MDLQEFLIKYPEWLRRNGITSDPITEKAEWTGVAGVEPPTYLTWTNAVGFRTQHSAELMMWNLAMLNHGLNSLKDFFAIPHAPEEVPMLSWADFLNPPPPPTEPAAVTIGAQVPAEIVARHVPSGLANASRNYFYKGNLMIPAGHFYDAPDGKRYLATRVDLFVTWLMEL